MRVVAGVIRMLRKKGGVRVESMLFPDEEHGLTLYASRLAAYTGVRDFFDRMLNKTTSPSASTATEEEEEEVVLEEEEEEGEED